MLRTMLLPAAGASPPTLGRALVASSALVASTASRLASLAICSGSSSTVSSVCASHASVAAEGGSTSTADRTTAAICVRPSLRSSSESSRCPSACSRRRRRCRRDSVAAFNSRLRPCTCHQPTN
eukprot:747969-Prorocentrum_minimum.AAC.3